MESSEPLRILVAGSDALARRGLADVLSDHPGLHVVAQVSLSGSLATAIQLHRPDAVLVDPGPFAGVSALREVQGVPVLVLATDAERATDAMAAGARGALFRDGDPGSIAVALQAIDRGLLVLDGAFAEAWRRPARTETDAALTARELEVLALLAEGLSNKEIATALGISAHTAKFHVNAVMAKLDAATRTEAVTRAARQGLLRL